MPINVDVNRRTEVDNDAFVAVMRSIRENIACAGRIFANSSKRDYESTMDAIYRDLRTDLKGRGRTLWNQHQYEWAKEMEARIARGGEHFQ